MCPNLGVLVLLLTVKYVVQYILYVAPRLVISVTVAIVV